MGSANFSSDNIADDGTLSGSNVESNLPLTNMQDAKLTKVTRWTTTNIEFDLDLGSQQDVNVLALIKHNLTDSATWRVRFANVSDFSVLVDDSGNVDAWDASEPGVTTPTSVYLPGSTITAQYIRVNLDDSTNSDGYVEAGRLWVADGYEPTLDPDYGLTIEFVDPSRKQRARGGQPWVETLQKYRKWTIDWTQMGSTAEDEMFDNLYVTELNNGIAGDVFFILDVNATSTFLRKTIYGTLSKPTQLVFSKFRLFKKPLVIEESI